jgi:hypothetical protein
MDLDFANNGRYCMRKSLDGDEKISSCKSNLFSAATQPKYFCVCRSVAADAKYKSLMINKRTDYVEALSLSHPPPASEGKEELRRRCLIGIERSKTTHLFPRIAYPSRGSVICFPFAPPPLSRALCLCLSRTIAVDTGSHILRAVP